MLIILDICYRYVNFITDLLTNGLRKVSFILLMFISFGAQSQTDLASLLATGSQVPVNEKAQEKLQSFIQSLPTSHLSGQRLLRKTFKRLHSTFLKKYEAYADFDKVFTTGHYDCLTGTTLFSQVLDQLNYSYDIIETNYHIFIIVNTERGDVLLETTDRFGGFVSDKKEIAKRTGDYHKNRLIADNSRANQYQYSFSLYQKITPERLKGLLYFNQAVKAYNHHDWLASSKFLEKANALYSSQRCEELGVILIQTILEKSLEEKVKAECLVHLRNFWIRKTEPVASN